MFLHSVSGDVLIKKALHHRGVEPKFERPTSSEGVGSIHLIGRLPIEGI
jgi:hypothetical protein